MAQSLLFSVPVMATATLRPLPLAGRTVWPLSGPVKAGRSPGGRRLPSVVKAGFGVGGEYGEGALRIGGRSVGYYNTAAASVGFQLGVRSRAEVPMFMTQDALERFQSSDGWEVGVDGSVALIKVGVAGEIDTNTISDPVIGFVFGEQGLMANLSLEGARITRMAKS
jgi:lipid-binding SYLF domain-containing protein